MSQFHVNFINHKHTQNPKRFKFKQQKIVQQKL